MAKAYVVEDNAKHNLVNIGVLDAGVPLLDALALMFARAGISEFSDEFAKLRNDMFNAKMDMRRAANL